MLTFRLVTALDEAVARAQQHLLSCQAADGHWVGELEADRALTAEALLLRQLIDRVDRSVERRAVTYLRRRQNEDGGWSLFESGESDLSATIKIYFAMKLAGVSPEDPAMQRARARQAAITRNLYTWSNYKSWADQVRDSWHATDGTGASGAAKPKK